MTQRILITGANGFIGRHLVSTLAEHDIDLVLMVRTGSESEVSALNQASNVVSSPDIFSEQPQWWAEKLADVDVVIHAAWHTNPVDYMTSSQNHHCEIGTLRMAEGLRMTGVRRFVGIGTCLEYEQTGQRLTTQTRLMPESPYAIAKARTYVQLEKLLMNSHVQFAWCRLFYLYGPGEHESRLVPYLHRELSQGRRVMLKNPHQLLDFLDVRDVARKIAQVALSQDVGSFNVCSGVGRTVGEVSREIAAEYGQAALIDFAEDHHKTGPPIVGEPSV